jgi:hypothetical protein
MMGIVLLLVGPAWLLLKAFHFIAEDQGRSLMARDVGAW